MVYMVSVYSCTVYMIASECYVKDINNTWIALESAVNLLHLRKKKIHPMTESVCRPMWTCDSSTQEFSIKEELQYWIS